MRSSETRFATHEPLYMAYESDILSVFESVCDN